MVKPSAVIRNVVLSALALGAGCVVFVLVFNIWPSIMQRALDGGGRSALVMANHFVMLFLGLSIGAVVILLCARRDFVTPVIAALVLFVFGLLAIMMSMVEARSDSDIPNAVADVFLAWFGYVLSVGVVLLVRRRRTPGSQD